MISVTGAAAGSAAARLPYPDESRRRAAAARLRRPTGQPPVYGHQLDQQRPPAPPPQLTIPMRCVRRAPIGAAPQRRAAAGRAVGNSASCAAAGGSAGDRPAQGTAGQSQEAVGRLSTTKEPAGTIIIDTPHTYLYLVLGDGKAIRYGIGVGREGFTWAGTERISSMKEWPDWFPPAEMIERQPYLPRMMAGGPGNPLGARALYLGHTLYRIHGTNQPSTIGQYVSSGCIRLLNEDIEDLFSRVQVGTRVVVLPGKAPQTAANHRRAAERRPRRTRWRRRASTASRFPARRCRRTLSATVFRTLNFRQPRDRLDHGAGIGNALAGDVVRAAVRHRREQDRRADRQAGGAVEGQQLGGDVALVVQHHDIGVAAFFAEHGVGAERAGHVDAGFRGARDRRDDDIDLFASRTCPLRRHAD